MIKRLFVFLVALMSLSLIGIIFVQLYWIKQSVEDKEEQFTTTVTDVLNRITDRIEDREVRGYIDKFLANVDSIGKFKSANLQNIFFVDSDINSNEILLYKHGILEEEYNIASTFFDNNSNLETDSTTITSITSKRTTTIYKEEFGLDGKQIMLTPVEKLEKIGGLSSIDRAQFDDVLATGK